MQSTEARVGEVLDSRYRVTGQLGSGGMGVVYRAEHVGIHRQVAVKVLHPALAQNPELLARFEREALTAGRIQHPNSVQVSDFGRLSDGRLYLVMELVDGRSLAEELQAVGRIHPVRALRICRHVLCALAHAHSREVVHRDVKPENVILCPQNGDPDYAKLLDFSIAKLVGPSAKHAQNDLTNTGVAVGTPAYVAPEQALGDPVDGRTDLYSLTSMLFEMVSGAPPYGGEEPREVLRAHLEMPIPPLHMYAPDVSSPPLENIIQRGMAKQREERFSSAEEYIAAIDVVLSILLQQGAQHLPPLPMSQKTPNLTSGRGLVALAKQKPAWALGIGAGLLVLIATLVPGRSKPQAMNTPVTPAIGAPTALDDVTPPPPPPPKPVASPPPPEPAPEPQVAVAPPPDVLAEPDSDDPNVIRTAVEKLSARGEYERATQYLLKHPKVVEGDPASQMLLGHAACRSGHVDVGLSAYRTAMEMEPGLASDSQMRSVLLEVAQVSDIELSSRALELAALKLFIREARDMLAARAATHPDPLVRDRARRICQEGSITWDKFTGYRTDLEQATGCKELKSIIGRLGALRDPRVVPVLEREMFPRTGEDPLVAKKRIGCISKPASTVMRKMRDD